MRLIDALVTTQALAEIFSDDAILRAMLEFEVVLARVEARLGVIPQSAADAIASVAEPSAFDAPALASAAARSGTLVVPFVKALTQIVGEENADAANYVHWAATSQDVSDTALVLLLKRAMPLIVADLTRVESALRKLSEQHANTVMLGRTLMQPATPITFGLKAAAWLGAIRRSRMRLEHACDEALVLQFGAATGTLAALGDQGPAVAHALATELDLPLPDAPWHTQRDRLAELVCACGVLVGALGKIARDISLMSQAEVAEVAEPSGKGRGGSSAMPHKNNPVGCIVALAAATRTPSLVASYLSAIVQENERAAGGSQAEWPIVTELVQATGAAADSIAEVVEGLNVDPVRMRSNIESTSGAVFAEKAAILLAKYVGKARAQELLEQAVAKALKENKSLAEVLREMPEAATHLGAGVLKNLTVPEDYLGSAEWFRKRLLETGTKKKD